MSGQKIGWMRSCLMFVVAGMMAAGHARAQPRAVIKIREEPDAEVMWFRPNAMLFTDRSYRLAECPAALVGKKFLRSSIDSTRFDVVQDGRLIVLTPHPVPGAASQSEALETQGFERVEED